MPRRRTPAEEDVRDALAEIREHSRAAARHERSRDAAQHRRDRAIVAALNAPAEQRPTHAQIAKAADISKSGIPDLVRRFTAKADD